MDVVGNILGVKKKKIKVWNGQKYVYMTEEEIDASVEGGERLAMHVK